ncbi:MAG: type II toxin-antitoxin system PemK/MazF family toxin [Pseudonocardia sp.]|nr:type II toxin-antitoxin system PemK/MazF family toxin [Pseudonocardia sp.]
MRRGEIWRYKPVLDRPGQSTLRLIVSSDAVTDRGPAVYAVHVLTDNPGSLLVASVGGLGWADVRQIDRTIQSRLVEHVGTATPEQMEDVDNVPQAVFDL